MHPPVPAIQALPFIRLSQQRVEGLPFPLDLHAEGMQGANVGGQASDNAPACSQASFSSLHGQCGAQMVCTLFVPAKPTTQAQEHCYMQHSSAGATCNSEQPSHGLSRIRRSRQRPAACGPRCMALALPCPTGRHTPRSPPACMWRVCVACMECLPACGAQAGPRTSETLRMRCVEQHGFTQQPVLVLKSCNTEAPKCPACPAAMSWLTHACTVLVGSETIAGSVIPCKVPLPTMALSMLHMDKLPL